MKRSHLYTIILVACLFGYAWLEFVFTQNNSEHSGDLNVCLIKNTIHIPCPSCGSTRSVIALWEGSLRESLLINPFGLIISLILIVAPLWIMFDIVRKKESFFRIYRQSEIILRKKQFSIPLIVFVIGNWIWNIIKHQ